MSIRDWPAAERPREKLLQRGPQALTDAELLAIFLRTGVAGCSAVELARQLLQQFGSLQCLLQAERRQFNQARGLGDAKYAQLQAVLEMARRHARESLERGVSFEQIDQVADFLRHRFPDQQREYVLALFLDTRHRLLSDELLFAGSIDGSVLHPRVVAQRALSLNAAALIVAHNHPSGVAEPSDCDVQITRRLRDALALVEVRLLDHFVVGAGCCTSLRQRGLL